MKTCGIIAEYNPFHRGHVYQIAQARQLSGCDVLIAVMAGNFTQRGEPAVIDKWTRAAAAVRGGIDLVIELPYFYATQSASRFAYGGLTLMKLAGVDALCFGSECGNLANLQEIADTPINPDHLHQSMAQGMSFPRAYSLLTSEMEPNDILAVSYLKELKGSGIQPLLIQRTTAYRDPAMHETASAMAIRQALKAHQDLGDSTPMKDALQQGCLVFPEQYYPYLRTFLLTSDPKQLSQLFLFSEGMENHLIRQAAACSSYSSFLTACTNYRYTAGRIRRCCLQAMNQVTKAEAAALPPLDTLRVLAFNETGRRYLHEQRKSGVRYASRFADVPYPWRAMEYRTNLLYGSVLPPAVRAELLRQEIGGALYLR